jgi:hypothetical protein
MTPAISPSPAARRASSEPAIKAPARRRRRQRRKPVHAQSGPHAAQSASAARSAPIATSVSAAITRRKLDALGRYTDETGRAREVIAGRRGDGCLLVVDRDVLTLGDRRLVACLDADEPAENAAVVCAHYLNDERRGRCRRVSVEDLIGEPAVAERRPRASAVESLRRTELIGRRKGASGYAYRLELVRTDGSAGELSWRRYSRRDDRVEPASVGLREVIGALESYEPVCRLTLTALAVYRDDPQVSVVALRGQLERVRESPIVLNRKLRQAVLGAGERDGVSMSEIALRCGRVKHDGKGNCSGETSWLARRLGILPESGAEHPTPWVHSDVLALIARSGLGISPREVELG